MRRILGGLSLILVMLILTNATSEVPAGPIAVTTKVYDVINS